MGEGIVQAGLFATDENGKYTTRIHSTNIIEIALTGVSIMIARVHPIRKLFSPRIILSNVRHSLPRSVDRMFGLPELHHQPKDSQRKTTSNNPSYQAHRRARIARVRGAANSPIAIQPVPTIQAFAATVDRLKTPCCAGRGKGCT